MLRTGTISVDGGLVFYLNLRLRLARLSTNQLAGLYLNLGGAQQVRGGRLLLQLWRMLLLWRGGSVLGWRGAVECCCSCSDRRCKRKGRDRGRCGDNWDHWDDGNGDLGRWKRGGRRGGRLMGLLPVAVIIPSDVVASDRLRQRGHKFHTL